MNLLTVMTVLTEPTTFLWPRYTKPKNMSEQIASEPPEGALVPDKPSQRHVVRIPGEVLTKIATNAWKLRNRMIDDRTKKPRAVIKKDDVKKLVSHVDSIFEALRELGLEIRDRTGERWTPFIDQK